MKLIKLSGKYGSIVGNYAQVDDIDYEKLNTYVWNARKGRHTYYAYRYIRNRKINKKWTYYVENMHRTVMNMSIDNTLLIDHADGNGLNNQRSNLREATHSQNQANKRKTKGSSIYLGVYKEVLNKKYRDIIYYVANCKNKNIVNVKRFKTEIEAAIQYNKWAIELHGEFANLNIIKNEMENSTRSTQPTEQEVSQPQQDTKVVKEPVKQAPVRYLIDDTQQEEWEHGDNVSH